LLKTQLGKKSSTVENKNFVPGTDVPYENWIQAWMVTLQQEPKEIKKRLISLLKKIKRDK
jgi:hypothetical protein|tara:strand:- start:53 stop:232 length:180 start_codon:yes stop_codon:yes gene_type:complete